MARVAETLGANERTVTVLCVASGPGMAALTGACLERASDCIESVTATTVTAAFEALQTHELDCIVSEYQMESGADGIVLLEGVRASHPELPFILFARQGSKSVASEAITTGVTDYVEQTTGTEQYDRLASRLLTAVEADQQRRVSTTPTDRAETVLEPAADPVLISVDGRCVYANESARTLLGESPVGRPAAEVLDLADSMVEAVESGDRTVNTLSTEAGSVSVAITARDLDWHDETGAAYVCPPTSNRGRAVAEQQHNALLDSVFDTAPDGILVIGPDGSVLTYNERFPSLWGLDASMLDGAEFDLVQRMLSDAAEETAAFEQAFSELRTVTEPQRTEITLSDTRVLEQHAVPLGSEGRLGTALYCRDLSEIHLGSARESVFDHMSDAVCVLDTDWQFTYANDHALELTGRSRDELFGTTLWEAFPGIVGTDIEAGYRKAAETGETFTTETYYEPLGKFLEIRAYPSDTGMVIYFQDISHERDIETELRETIDELKSLYELAADQESSFEEKRQRLLRVGTEYLNLPYGFVSKIIDDEQRIVESIGNHDLLQPGEACPLEESYCRKTVVSDSGFLAVENALSEGWDGDLAYETFELGTYIGAKLLVNGELYGTLCFASTEPRDRGFTDSEQTLVEVMAKWLSYEYGQQAYRQRLEAQNDRLERFAGMVSHDLRNPLNVAMTRLELLSDETDSEHLDAVGQAHERMETLIEDILLLARQDGGVSDTTELSLGAVAARAWENVDTTGATLSVADDRQLSADESRLVQVFENLYRNAIEHGADEGSELTVAVGPLEDGFYVEDTGCGIPGEDRDEIFEEGVSGASSGNGLGLSIVSDIVDAHDWQITATASDTGGARFEITGVE